MFSAFITTMRRFKGQLNSLEVYRFLFHTIAMALLLFAPVLLRPDADITRRFAAEGHFPTGWQMMGAITVVLYFMNVYLFIPIFLKQGKYVKYFIALVLMFIVSSYLISELLQMFPMARPVLPEGVRIRQLRFVQTPRFSMLPAAMSMALGTSFEMILNWEIQRKEKIQIEREKMSAELSFLKSQVNPHFLFNSLNSIYALAEQNSQRTGEAILLLSNLMRYMLYGSNNGKSEIGKEIDCIENYIQLQRLRISSRESINIQLQITGRELKVFIEPLILLPFIENAFKHGVSYSQKSEVLIMLNVENDLIELFVRNTKKTNPVSEHQTSNDSGIGLTNIKRRLELLYPSRHSLEIEDSNGYFSIQLKIQP